MRKNSIKNVRINSEVQRELSRIIRSEVKDPRISPMTSVTGVEVAPDLKTCKVHISVLGSPEEVEETIEGLHSANSFIRGALARSVNLRNTPEIRFIPDASIAYGVTMTQRIDAVIAEDEQRAAATEKDAGESSAENGFEEDPAEEYMEIDREEAAEKHED